jgi:hypothetical protein
MNMKRLVTIAASIGLAVLSAPPLAAESMMCGTGTLSDVEVVIGRVPQSTITSVQKKPKSGNKPGEQQIDAFTTPAERQTRTYLVTVRLNDLVYTGQSSGNEFWNFDPTRLVINDPIEACVSGRSLRLRRPDGKDYKTKIVRVIRDVTSEVNPG